MGLETLIKFVVPLIFLGFWLGMAARSKRRP